MQWNVNGAVSGNTGTVLQLRVGSIRIIRVKWVTFSLGQARFIIPSNIAVTNKNISDCSIREYRSC